MHTVLVTGAAGFIGSKLCEELLARGYRVVGVDNFSDDLYDPKFKEEHIQTLVSNPNFSLHREDICNLSSMRELFSKEKPKYVAHLAAKANTRKAVSSPQIYIDVNITGTLNILELSKEFGVENVVIASSSSVYGNSQRVPWREDDSADRPLSPYGQTKRSDEILAYTYHHNFKQNVTCLRYFNAYGEHNRPDLVPYLWSQALLRGEEIEMSGDGSRKRDYTYIGGFEIINLGDSQPVSLKELLSTLEEVSGIKAAVKSRPSHPSSVESTYADITKAKELLDWEPKTDIKSGMSKLFVWVRDCRSK
jgi:UDP-glucuronate 4-epimerase